MALEDVGWWDRSAGRPGESLGAHAVVDLVHPPVISGSAAAFVVCVGGVLPGFRLPLGAAAAVVVFSRVYPGVLYPGDVVVGGAVGGLFGRATLTVARRLGRR